jgi:hypothetical protein
LSSKYNKSDRSLLSDFNDSYEDAYLAWDSFYPQADKDLRFFLGDQWDETEKRALHSEGRNTFVFNRIRPVVNMITGYQRQHRLSSVVAPVENSDQKTADQLSQCMLHVMNYGDGYRTISDCFGGACKTGWNLASIWMDYRDDPINGDIKFSREPWSGFITDPYLTKLDFSDCAYIMRRKYLSADLVASLLPGQEKDVYRLQQCGWSRDDKFTWLPYQRQPAGQELMAYNEFYRQKWEQQEILVDMETGEFRDWDAGDGLFQQLKAINPSFELSTRQKKYVERVVIVNDEVMREDINPYGLDEYPFVPFTAIWEPESDDWSLKTQSLIRCMIDPQREANKRRSQMTDLLDSQINSGYIATEGSVVNPRSLFQSSQGKVIWRARDAAPGSIEKIPPAQIPPSMFQLQQQFDADIKEIAGVNDAAFGVMESGNESGVLTMLRQGAALTNLQDVFDNLRFSQKYMSQKALKLIQQWTPQKVQRIINQEPTEEFYNNEFTKYDCAVQEGVLTDTQRQVFFRQLLDLKQLGEPIPPGLLAKAAPIQGKSEYYEEMDKFQKAQAESAALQQETQDKLLQAQMELAQSQSLQQVAGAKERFTRSVANMGLSDERASESVQNSTQAVLDQVKAIKELEEMDLRNAKEELVLTEMLRNQNRLEEEKLKSDNVMISDAGARTPQSPEMGNSNNQEVSDERL